MYTVINTCKRGQVQQEKFCREMGALHCLTKCGIVTLNLHCCLGSGMLTKQLLQDWKHKQGSFAIRCLGFILLVLSRTDLPLCCFVPAVKPCQRIVL